MITLDLLLLKFLYEHRNKKKKRKKFTLDMFFFFLLTYVQVSFKYLLSQSSLFFTKVVYLLMQFKVFLIDKVSLQWNSLKLSDEHGISPNENLEKLSQSFCYTFRFSSFISSMKICSCKRKKKKNVRVNAYVVHRWDFEYNSMEIWLGVRSVQTFLIRIAFKLISSVFSKFCRSLILKP
jgi:hypothetical protein